MNKDKKYRGYWYGAGSGLGSGSGVGSGTGSGVGCGWGSGEGYGSGVGGGSDKCLDKVDPIDSFNTKCSIFLSLYCDISAFKFELQNIELDN